MFGSKPLLIGSLIVLACLGVALGVFLPDFLPSKPGSPETEQENPSNSAVPGPASPQKQPPPQSWDSRLGHQPVFTDVTQAAGIEFKHTNGLTGRNEYLEIMGGGVAVFDYDNDGDLDIYFVNGNRIDGPLDPKITSRLYRNDGGWKFTDVTKGAGVGNGRYGQGCTAADYDADGDLDLFVTNYGPSVLYQNNGDGTFADVTAQAGIDHDGWGQSVCFFDYDADDHLDLYVQNYLVKGSTEGKQSFIMIGDRRVSDYSSPLGFPPSESVLYRNLGNGTFRDVTADANLKLAGKGMGLAAADFNGDRLVDIFVANDTMENFLFRGEVGGTFSEVGSLAGVAYNSDGIPEASMGVDVADYDNDGDLDLIVPCLARQSFTLYRNDGGQFTEVSSPAGLAEATGRHTGFDAHFLDYDNDADLDLFFTCGGVRLNESAGAKSTYNEKYGITDLLLANDGQGNFRDVSSQAGPYFARGMIGRGSAAGDLDNDGDVDLVVSNLNDRPAVLRNDTHGGNWITVDLVDADGRKNPDGVSVWVTLSGRKQYAVTHPGVTYLSQSDRRIRFGLGSAKQVDSIEIQWPSGNRQSLSQAPAKQELKVTEKAAAKSDAE